VAEGRIASVSGTSMQLEGELRRSVNWTDRTSFTEISDASKADLVIGACARVRPSRTVGGPSRSQPQHLAAALVTIGDTVDGICVSDMGPGGLPGTGLGSAPPDESGPRFEWRPAPSAPASPRGGFYGLVTAIDGDSFTIEMRRRDVGPSGTSARPISQRVSITAQTEWQRTARVEAGAVQVGKCALATGRPTEPGNVTADSITLRPARDNQCRSERVGRVGKPEDDRGTSVGQGPQRRPEHRQPWVRRVPEGPGPGTRQDRQERPRREPRPEPRHEAPSGGSGAGGGAASTQTR
jgi:hypothetical protein